MAFGWVSLALMYLFFLFYLARWGDRNSQTARWLTSHPAIYSLALAIYCTAWTFFGAVGQASDNSWFYLPILLGPTLVYVFGYRFIYKMTLVSKKQHINTISDFIASRYGKRQVVALMVTVIALLATIPYIALQLKAIGSTFQLLTNNENSDFIIVISTAFIALFAIYFGTKQTDVTEYRRGLMLAIAFESSVKLIALVLVAFVGYKAWQSTQMTPILGSFFTDAALSQLTSPGLIAQTLMAGAAIICLPRQFHVAIVDNLSLNHLKTARWLFPLYLTIIAAVIPIIAMGGSAIFRGTGVEPDSYVLSLALFSDAIWLQIIVFIGGLSASTAMIIVATLTLSTMLTNDVILPRIFSVNGHETSRRDFSQHIRLTRRVVIGVILLLAFFYHQQMTNSRSLHSIGLVAFSLVIQLLPAIVGGLYWKRGHAHGVYAGLLVGLVCWILWLWVPTFTDPYNYQNQNNALSIGALVSLVANALAYVFFSLRAPARLIDRIQAEAFVSPADMKEDLASSPTQDITNEDLVTLLSTFMGKGRCLQLIKNYEQANQVTIKHSDIPKSHFMAFCERALGGVLGAASAKVLTDSVLKGKKLDFTEIINFFDDTTQAMQFNMTALLTSLENMDQGISVVDKHLNLVAWNKQYAALYNYPDDLLVVGTPIEKLIRYNAERGEFGSPNVEKEIEKRLTHLRSGTSHRFTRQRGDGKVVEMVGNPLPGGGFVTSFNDITGHVVIQQALEESNINLEHRIKKRTEEVHSINAELRLEIERRRDVEKALIKARKSAEEANASKTRFLALASHDVLQPLNAAKLYVSALQEADLSSSTETIVDKLERSVASSEAIISELLDISRLDQGELKASPERIFIPDLLAPLIDEMVMRAREKGLQLKHRISPCWVYSDKTFLYRIIQNLVSNAVKYTEKGKILISIRKVAGQVKIQIWDTGVGLSEDQQSLIFSDFYRTNENKEHGVGLGLGVVRRLSQQIDVAVNVRSVLGKGSCFSFHLPLVAPPAEQPAKKVQRQATFKGLRVLCVDDQQENLDAMETLLTRWGLNVVLADCWDDAIKQADIFSPQILLMDYHLGNGKNGLELIEAIRHHLNVVLPATLITATHEESLEDNCKEFGVNYLPKPVKPAKLRALLMSMTRYIKDARTES